MKLTRNFKRGTNAVMVRSTVFRSMVFRSAVYRAIVFTTALLCFLSFASAEQFAPHSAGEVKHYTGDDDFICSRNASDDRSDVLQNDVDIAVLHFQYFVIPKEVTFSTPHSYSLPAIRGPPAIASLI